MGMTIFCAFSCRIFFFGPFCGFLFSSLDANRSLPLTWIQRYFLLCLRTPFNAFSLLAWLFMLLILVWAFPAAPVEASFFQKTFFCIDFPPALPPLISSSDPCFFFGLSNRQAGNPFPVSSLYEHPWGFSSRKPPFYFFLMFSRTFFEV